MVVAGPDRCRIAILGGHRIGNEDPIMATGQ